MDPRQGRSYGEHDDDESTEIHAKPGRQGGPKRCLRPCSGGEGPGEEQDPEGRSPMGSLTSKDKKASKNKKPSTMTESKPSSDAGRLQALERALGQIEKNYGSGAIMRLGARLRLIPASDRGAQPGPGPRRRRLPARTNLRDLRSRVDRQDDAGAADRGRRRSATGGVAAFIDAEHALDPAWAQKLGVDLEELLV